MLLKIYRGIGPGTILLIFVSMLLLWLQALLDPGDHSIYGSHPAPLYALLLDLFGGRPHAGIIFSMLLVMLTAIYLVNFNTRLFFINERTFLPASIYVLLSGFIVNNQVLNPVLPAALLLLMSIDRLIVSYRKPGIAYNLFDASMLIGIAALIHTNIIWYYALIIIGISLFRSFSFREFLISFSGLLTPFIIMYSYWYLAGRDINGLNSMLTDSLFTEIPEYSWSLEVIIVSAVNLLISVIALLHLWSIFNTKKVRSRKIFSLLIWMVLITLVIYFLVPSSSVGLLFVLLIPLAFILTHYLVMMRNKKIANFVFAIIFLSVLFLQLRELIFI
ncbi:MAG: hypothetical protein ACQETA_01935 [Bacteroidota bacterium]